MTEAFLHYIWQYQYFDKKELKTAEGEEITILKTGTYNTHAGPDFLQAKLKIGSLEWVGNVELHIHASGWLQHSHQHDKAYDNVVLHVVWKNDKPIVRSDGTHVPTLELKNRIDETLLLNYRNLVNSPAPIPCQYSLSSVSDITRLSTLERALAQRLETKAVSILARLKKNSNNWEETFYQTLGRNVGFKVNAEPFEKLAESVPYKVILKHSDKLQQVEALLFGTAGFLEKPVDEYADTLKREYRLLSAKFELHTRQLHKTQWRFLRLRPANFPTLRIAQFASLLSQRKNIFSSVLAAESCKELLQLFDVPQSPYWQQHYQFGKAAKSVVPAIGDSAIENIIINTVAPVLAAYSLQKDELLWMERALLFLSQLPPENNSITRQWSDLNWKTASAFDSQGLIELKNNACNKRLCLQCSIGTTLIRHS